MPLNSILTPAGTVLHEPSTVSSYTWSTPVVERRRRKISSEDEEEGEATRRFLSAYLPYPTSAVVYSFCRHRSATRSHVWNVKTTSYVTLATPLPPYGPWLMVLRSWVRLRT